MDKFRITLTDEERPELEQLVSIDKAAARKLIHARVLLLADAAPTTGRTAKDLFDIIQMAPVSCGKGIPPGLYKTGPPGSTAGVFLYDLALGPPQVSRERLSSHCLFVRFDTYPEDFDPFLLRVRAVNGGCAKKEERGRVAVGPGLRGHSGSCRQAVPAWRSDSLRRRIVCRD